MEQLRIKALNVVRLIMFIIVLAMLPTVVNANEELKTKNDKLEQRLFELYREQAERTKKIAERNGVGG